MLLVVTAQYSWDKPFVLHPEIVVENLCSHATSLAHQYPPTLAAPAIFIAVCYMTSQTRGSSSIWISTPPVTSSNAIN